MTNVAHHIRSRFDCLLDPLNADLIDLITFCSVYDIIVGKTARDVPRRATTPSGKQVIRISPTHP